MRKKAKNHSETSHQNITVSGPDLEESSQAITESMQIQQIQKLNRLQQNLQPTTKQDPVADEDAIQKHQTLNNSQILKTKMPTQITSVHQKPSHISGPPDDFESNKPKNVFRFNQIIYEHKRKNRTPTRSPSLRRPSPEYLSHDRSPRYRARRRPSRSRSRSPRGHNRSPRGRRSSPNRYGRGSSPRRYRDSSRYDNGGRSPRGHSPSPRYKSRDGSPKYHGHSRDHRSPRIENRRSPIRDRSPAKERMSRVGSTESLDSKRSIIRQPTSLPIQFPFAVKDLWSFHAHLVPERK